MTRSRLSRRMENKTKKNLALSLLGIILVIFVAFRLGIPFLVNLSLFLSGSKGNQEQSQNQNPSFIAPPILDSLPQATSSANVVISGAALKNQTINLYINNELIDSIKTKDNGKFKFEETIKPGENIIKAKAVINDKESEFSQSLTINLKNTPPSLTITSPSNDQTFSKDQSATEIKGTTDGDATVTVNGFRAITDTNGNFSYRLPLQNGENKIAVIAIDIAGNKTEREIKVTYSP